MAALVLCAFGLFVSATLSLGEVRGAVVPCGGSMDCSIVAGSSYSRFLGLPVAYYGLAAYAALMLLTLASCHWPRSRLLAVILSGVGLLVSALLVAISAFLIHATCKWCLASAGTMATLFPVSLARARTTAAAPVVPFALVASVLSVAALVGANRVLRAAPSEIVNRSVLRQLPLDELVPPDAPVKGSSEAPVTLVEFADFACPACRDVFGRLNKVLAHNEGVRVVFRNFPQPRLGGHEASRYGAVCGEAAASHGKFWEFVSQAYGIEGHPSEADYDRVLASLGVSGPATRLAGDRVDRDVALAHRLDLTLTPLFVVMAPGADRVPCTNVNLAQVLQRPEFARYIRGIRQVR